MKHATLSHIFAAAFLSAAFVAPSVSFAAVSCTKITADIGTGSSDTTWSQNVIAFQRFLVASGYMTATPNGYFGPSTTAATKVFQSVKGISATGFVGPLTRAAVESASCSKTSVSPTPAPSSNDSSSSDAPVLRDPSSTLFSAPKSKEVLAMGKSYKISWKAPSSGSYSLVLDNATSTARGVIAYYAPDSGRQTWDIGSVSVSGSSNTEFVEPGMYRLRLQDRTQGPTASDQVSAWFEISAPAASVRTMLPSSSIPADGKTAVVMYGAGFTQGTSIYVYDSYKKWVNVLFTSLDGTVLVFSVPNDISAGTYDMIITDRYGAVSTGPKITIKKS